LLFYFFSDEFNFAFKILNEKIVVQEIIAWRR